MKFTKKADCFMIRFNKILLFILELFCFIPVFSQNLFDEANTYKFTDYLFKTQQYQLASQEYERLVILAPTNNAYKLSLVQCYRLNANYSIAENRFLNFFGDSLFNLSTPVSTEYLKIKVLQEDLGSVQKFLDRQSRLDPGTRQNFQESVFLLNKRWKQSDSLLSLTTGLNPQYSIITKEGLSIKYKKPFVAAMFSTVLPGSGKFYTGDWKDGLIAFLFVAANSWQSYRGFSKYGTSNAHGWIFGGLGAGFYLGNIYGSWKSAVRHNKKANDDLYKRAKAVIYSGF